MTEIIEEPVIECAVCSTDIDPDDSYITESQEVVCPDCVQCCNRCGDIGTENDSWFAVDGDSWCENCTERWAQYCDHCEEYGSDSTHYISDRDCYWCNGCVEDTFYCDDCNSYYDCGYCEDCSGNSKVHDYMYKPDPIFHTTKDNEKLFFGIEVEMELGSNIGDASEYAYQLEERDLAYLKSDGSLSCGFEVVTHPMTHDFYKNEAHDLFAVLDTLREDYKAKSWGTGTCGVHVHVSRSGFNGGAHMHRFLNLVYSNKDLFSTIAGRESDRWAKFDDVETGNGKWMEDSEGRYFKPTRTFARKLDPRRQTDRYSAVNTKNSATLEIRIFKGSTQAHVIKSYIDLAHASVEYTRTLSVKEIANGALMPEPFVEYIASNEKLYAELIERIGRLYVNPNDIVSASRQNVSN